MKRSNERLKLLQETLIHKVSLQVLSILNSITKLRNVCVNNVSFLQEYVRSNLIKHPPQEILVTPCVTR